MDIAVQRYRRFLARGYRVDGKARTGVAVAANEDVRLRGLIGQGVSLGGAFLRRHESAHIEAAPIDGLADRADHAVKLYRLKLTGADRSAASLLIRLAKFHCFDLERADLAVTADDLDRCVEEAELHALLHRLLDLFGVGGHFILRAAVDDIGLLRAETHRAAAHIHRNVTAADDRTALADRGLAAEVHLAQELHAAEHALKLLAGDIELCRLLRADGEIEALIALIPKLLDRDVPADLDAAAELHAHLAEDIDLSIEHILLKAEGRYAEREHAAGDGVAVKHRDGVALVCKVICAAHAGRARADDCYFLGIRSADLVHHLGDKARRLVHVMVGDKSLDLVYRDGLVDAAAGAFGLAALVAYASADCRERVLFLYKLQRVGVSALRGKLQIALHGDMRGAGGLARGSAGGHNVLAVLAVIFIDSLGEVESLSDLGIFRLGQRAVGAELLAELQRVSGADLDALRTGDALCLVHFGDEV